VIFALVHEGSGFLTVREVVHERNAVFFGKNFARDFAVQYADPLLEAFEQTNFGIVSFQNPLGRKQFKEEFDEQSLLLFGALAEGLKHEVIAVTVYDNGRQLVGFAVNEPISLAILDDGLPERCCAAEAFSKELSVNGHVLVGQKSDRDLRFVAVEGASMITAALIGYPNDGAGLSLR
jgi:hypothetical protein